MSRRLHTVVLKHPVVIAGVHYGAGAVRVNARQYRTLAERGLIRRRAARRSASSPSPQHRE